MCLYRDLLDGHVLHPQYLEQTRRAPAEEEPCLHTTAALILLTALEWVLRVLWIVDRARLVES